MNIHSYEFYISGKLLGVWQTPSTDGWRNMATDHMIYINNDNKLYRIIGVCHMRFPSNRMLIEVIDTGAK